MHTTVWHNAINPQIIARGTFQDRDRELRVLAGILTLLCE